MMNQIDLIKLLGIAQTAAQAGAVEIMKVYNSVDFGVELKADESPLTRADAAAHKAIVSHLSYTDLPILSEEGKSVPFEDRKEWDYFWMVDPLDGTKEFIKRNGEFTVNIALIKKNRVVLGVVQIPVTNELYYAVEGNGAYKREQSGEKKLQASGFSMQQSGLKVVASRSHMNEDTSRFLSELSEPHLLSKGSSIKLLLVAEGAAHVYPRFAPTMEWDTAAAQIIVEEAGGKVLIKDTQSSVSYNKENLLNPHFLVTGHQIT